MRLSKINTKITDEYLKKSVESLYFDRKRGKIKPLDLANTIAAFANANGGVVAVGITDDGKYEGLNTYGEEVFNNIQKCVVNFLSPLPLYKTEIINIKNDNGVNDIIILFHVLPASNYIIRNVKDEVYLRQGDSSVKLNSNQVRSLEYDKNQREAARLPFLNFELMLLKNLVLHRPLSLLKIFTPSLFRSALFSIPM